MGSPIISPAQWEQIKLAAVAGAEYRNIMAAFPGLTLPNLRKAALRGNWPTPSRIEAMALKRATEPQNANGAHHSDPSQIQNGMDVAVSSAVAVLSQQASDSLRQPQMAMQITLESTRGGRNATLAGWSNRKCKALENAPDRPPMDLMEELAIVRTLARLDGGQGGQVNNVQIIAAGPWTASGRQDREWIEAEEVPE